MSHRRLFGLMGALALAAFASAQSSLTFLNDLSGSASAYDAANDVAVDAAGDIVTVGHKTDASGNRDAVIVKQDRFGVVRWSRSYKGNGNGPDSAVSAAIDADGNVYVACTITDALGGLSDVATLKYSPSGTLLWVGKFNGVSNGTDAPVKLALDAQGNVVVAGNTTVSGTGYFGRDFVALKYAPDGTLLWTALYDGPAHGQEDLVDMAVAPDGAVVLAGTVTTGSGSGPDIGTVAYGPDGTLGWASTYNELDYDGVRGVAVGANGEVTVIGYTRDPWYGFDFLALRYGSRGDLRWRRTYGYRRSESADMPNDVEMDAEGNAYVVGYSLGDTQGNECATIKLDPNGALLWANRFNQASGANADVGVKLKVDAAGRVYVLGEAILPFGSALQRDLFALRLNVDGSVLSSRSFGGANSDNARGLALDARGNMAVAATAMNGNYGSFLSAATAQITVRPDAYVLPEDNVLTTSAPTGVLGNDESTTGVLPPLQLVTSPAHGKLSLSPNGAFSYTPDPNYNGPDGFTYRLQNAGFTSDLATVAFDVQARPDAPIALDDAAGLAGNVPKSLAVLANDRDPDGDPLKVGAVGTPTKGTVTIAADGTLRYVPNLWAGGREIFSYAVADPSGDYSVANVDLTIFAADVSGEVSVVATAPKLDRKTGRYEQTVTLTNVGTRSIPNLRLLLGGLSGGTLQGASGASLFWTPGSPFVAVDTGRDGVLSRGERVKLTLAFSGGSPSYAAKTLAGQGAP